MLARHVTPESVALLDQSLTEIRTKVQQLEEQAGLLERDLARSQSICFDPDEVVMATLDERLDRFDELFNAGTIPERRSMLRLFVDESKSTP